MKRKYSKEVILPKAHALHREGKSWQTVSRELNIPQSTLHSWVNPAKGKVVVHAAMPKAKRPYKKSGKVELTQPTSSKVFIVVTDSSNLSNVLRQL